MPDLSDDARTLLLALYRRHFAGDSGIPIQQLAQISNVSAAVLERGADQLTPIFVKRGLSNSVEITPAGILKAEGSGVLPDRELLERMSERMNVLHTLSKAQGAEMQVHCGCVTRELFDRNWQALELAGFISSRWENGKPRAVGFFTVTRAGEQQLRTMAPHFPEWEREAAD